jgi:hypothetical protein
MARTASSKPSQAPGTRRPGRGSDQRRYDRVFGELGRDGERIGGKIEDPPEARQDLGQRG